MSYTTIRRALDTGLNTWASSYVISVAWPNIKFDGALPYVGVFFLPAETETLGLAVGSADSKQGIYQVSVYTELNGGTQELESIISSLESTFYKGAKFSNVLIEKIWTSAAIKLPEAWSTPVSIQYRVIE